MTPIICVTSSTRGLPTLIASLLATSVACGGTVVFEDDGAGEGGASASSVEAPSASATTSAASGGAGGGEEPPALPDSGAITFIQVHPPSPSNLEVVAAFQRGPYLDDEPGCEIEERGDCALHRCPVAFPEPHDDGLDAGVISVSGTVADVALEREPGGAYRWSGSGQLFEPGATLTASGTGGDVPPFSLQLQAPPKVTEIEPQLSDVELRPGEDLSVRWIGDGSTSVQLVMFAVSAASYSAVLCRTTAGAGSLTVPSDLVPPPGDEYNYLYLSTRSAGQLEIGSHEVHVFAIDILKQGFWEIE
jgi:hypothetical protein